MDEYDIFENGIWCCAVVGEGAALDRAKELAAGSINEFVVMHLPSKRVVAKMNTAPLI